MPTLVPVDHDPFAGSPDAAQAASPQLVPVDHDPFAETAPNPVDQMRAAAAKLGIPASASDEDRARAVLAATRGGQARIEGAASAADSPVSSALLAGAGNVLSGVPVAGPALLGGVQRGSAAARSAIAGTPYADELNFVQGAQGEADTEHPVVAKAANVAGAVGAAIPAAGTALGARAFGLVGAPLQRIATGALGGATIGAGDAAMRGESPFGGAVAGGSLGAVAPFIGQGIGKAAGAVADTVAPIFEGPLANVGRLGRRMLGTAVQDETPASIAAGQARVGPHGFLGDVGTSLTDLTGSIADQPGAGKAVIRDAYQARDAGDRDRITQAVTDAFGPSINIADLTRAQAAARSATADPLYAAWRNTPVQMTPDLQNILQNIQNFRPTAFTTAQRLAAGEGQSITNPGGQVTAMGWDYLKRAMNDAASTAGQGTNEARISGGIARHIVDAIDNHPDPNVAGVWKQARQAWADPSSIMEARESGQQVFSKAQRADELLYDVNGMSMPERSAFVQGARDQVQQIMDASTRGDTQARNMLLAPASQQKLAMILGPDRARVLAASLEQEGALKGQLQNVGGGTQTTPKAARLPLSSPPPPDTGAAGYAMNFQIDKPSTFVPGLKGWYNDFQNSRYADARARIAPLLTTAGPERDMLISELMRGAQHGAARTQTMNNIGDLATVLMNAVGAPEARRQLGMKN